MAVEKMLFSISKVVCWRNVNYNYGGQRVISFFISEMFTFCSWSSGEGRLKLILLAFFITKQFYYCSCSFVVIDHLCSCSKLAGI